MLQPHITILVYFSGAGFVIDLRAIDLFLMVEERESDLLDPLWLPRRKVLPKCWLEMLAISWPFEPALCRFLAGFLTTATVRGQSCKLSIPLRLALFPMTSIIEIVLLRLTWLC